MPVAQDEDNSTHSDGRVFAKNNARNAESKRKQRTAQQRALNRDHNAKQRKRTIAMRAPTSETIPTPYGRERRATTGRAAIVTGDSRVQKFWLQLHRTGKANRLLFQEKTSRRHPPQYGGYHRGSTTASWHETHELISPHGSGEKGCLHDGPSTVDLRRTSTTRLVMDKRLVNVPDTPGILHRRAMGLVSHRPRPAAFTLTPSDRTQASAWRRPLIRIMK